MVVLLTSVAMPDHHVVAMFDTLEPRLGFGGLEISERQKQNQTLFGRLVADPTIKQKLSGRHELLLKAETQAL